MSGWVRSSFCGGNGECIEARQSPTFGTVIELRQIKDGHFVTGLLTVTRAEWDAFVAGIKHGDFDHLQDTP